MSYYDEVYLKRLNRYGLDFQSRYQGQRERNFENYLLRTLFRVDFEYCDKVHPASLERYKQDYSETQMYLLTRADLKIPNGTILDIINQDGSQKKLVDKAIALYQRGSRLDEFIKAHPELMNLISPGLRPLNQLAREWMEKPYERNNKYPEDLRFSTVVPNLYVRSKAEADLVSRFMHFGVPFHYEEIQRIGREELAIDFTLLNVRAGRKLYWDHRGMADDPDYLKKTHYCEKLYLEAGIIPWVNMIVTAETKDSPLDIQWVDKLIDFYLL